MSEVLIVIHLLVVAALIGVVLLQRSEGGGLGMGSSGVSGFLTSRGKANILTRTTAILAALFFATSLALAYLAKPSDSHRSLFDEAPSQELPAAPSQAPQPVTPHTPQIPLSK
jgi:preprotein translocase subunit SecG